ncbi:uncharacterized protein HD556DRAFT_1496067 [Suillus plorans]|uniref:Uncharacterized protein n=1 Tax=Suillus plorans TaxID=116603 RepID=A0A9P7AHC6_9AGAM|nr:uncharacterized protein HD556DRAFT_1496067 [Suillus plorans]KAG1788855.1 hypothetical protein HD556DRAFT_1496067 [Suillus plorans]
MELRYASIRMISCTQLEDPLKMRDRDVEVVHNIHRSSSLGVRAWRSWFHCLSGRAGDLYVLLSRRSASLRQYAGDTALPGGKVEPQDITTEDTAVPIWNSFVNLGLTCLFAVTPVVVLILDNTMQPSLNESESFPFHPYRIPDPSIPYHTTAEWEWSGGGRIRMHSFLTGREADGVKPVFGLTVSMLIYVAIWGYRRAPDFELQPQNAPTQAQQIACALLTPSNPLRLACEESDLDSSKDRDDVHLTGTNSQCKSADGSWANINDLTISDSERTGGAAGPTRRRTLRYSSSPSPPKRTGSAFMVMSKHLQRASLRVVRPRLGQFNSHTG